MNKLAVLTLSCMALIAMTGCAGRLSATTMASETVTKSEYDALAAKLNTVQDEMTLLNERLSYTSTPTPTPTYTPMPIATNTPTPTNTPKPTSIFMPVPDPESYTTEITYNQLARNPDDHIGKKVKFTGKVLQVMENGKTVSLSIATSGNYDDVVRATYISDLVKSRILEDDIITIYGMALSLHKYHSIATGTISVPWILVDIIDQ